MGFLSDIWQRIGTKLYIALGFAVLLTLVSSAVGVYYFENSGDLHYQVRTEAVPTLEAAWEAARESERLMTIGLGLLADRYDDAEAEYASVSDSLSRLEASLNMVNAVPELASAAQAVQDTAYDFASVIDRLAVNRDAKLSAESDEARLRQQLHGITIEDTSSLLAATVLSKAASAGSESELQNLWDEFNMLHSRGIDPSLASLAGGEGVFAVRAQQLALAESETELTNAFNTSRASLESAVSTLLARADEESSAVLGLTVSSFDRGRLLLTIISVVSMIAATLAAWIWVGNGVLRRLSRMSERMRNMASGDLETPVPEVGGDEIGELANALEVFRQQALEVQRLNLVERLYEELRETNEELKQTQARLVAQEKLAALGELIAGVSHEIANPLNFMTNFSEGSLELYEELAEMLETYKSAMSEDDVNLLEEISHEISDSLNRVCINGARALAIVERMRGMGLEGGELTPIDINSILPQMVRVACEAFEAQHPDFPFQTEYELDESISEVLLSENDFGEAIMNLVSNACYAMMLKRENEDNAYEPTLRVASRLRDDIAEVRIRDNGTGIADDVLGDIFSPFFSTRDGAIGAGLGLPIAADVAKRLGGDMTVETEFGEYTEFTMTIPAPASLPTPTEDEFVPTA